MENLLGISVLPFDHMGRNEPRNRNRDARCRNYKKNAVYRIRNAVICHSLGADPVAQRDPEESAQHFYDKSCSGKYCRAFYEFFVVVIFFCHNAIYPCTARTKPPPAPAERQLCYSKASIFPVCSSAILTVLSISIVAYTPSL